MRLEFYAYKKAASFNEKEYKNIQDRVEDGHVLLNLFITNHPYFQTFNKPLERLSPVEKGLVYNEPVIAQFIAEHKVDETSPYTYWEEHSVDKISWRHYETLSLNRRELRPGAYSNNQDPDLIELYDRSGFLSPENRTEAITRLLNKATVTESALKLIHFLSIIDPEYWILFD
jgi:hypothetical protein